MRSVDEQPLAEVHQSALTGAGNQVVYVFSDRVEVDTVGLLNRKTESMRYDQMAGVRLRVGVVFAALFFESRGGSEVGVKSLPKAEARRAHDIVQERIGSAVSSAGAPASDIPGQIRRLAELRDAGIVSEAEFEAKKAELLKRM
jgi:hypothetical protein